MRFSMVYNARIAAVEEGAAAPVASTTEVGAAAMQAGQVGTG